MPIVILERGIPRDVQADGAVYRLAPGVPVQVPETALPAIRAACLGVSILASPDPAPKKAASRPDPALPGPETVEAVPEPAPYPIPAKWEREDPPDLPPPAPRKRTRKPRTTTPEG